MLLGLCRCAHPGGQNALVRDYSIVVRVAANCLGILPCSCDVHEQRRGCRSEEMKCVRALRLELVLPGEIMFRDKK